MEHALASVPFILCSWAIFTMMLFLNIWPTQPTPILPSIMILSSSNFLQAYHQATLLMEERLTIFGHFLTVLWARLFSLISKNSLRVLHSTTTTSKSRTINFGLPSEFSRMMNRTCTHDHLLLMTTCLRSLWIRY
jgi:hypothetical protein